MGRFEPSNKRCNNSAPVFQHPLFTFHPSFFLLPSLLPSLTSTLSFFLSARSLSNPYEKPFVCKTNKNRLLARVRERCSSGGTGGGDGGRGILITRILSVRVIIVYYWIWKLAINRLARFLRFIVRSIITGRFFSLLLRSATDVFTRHGEEHGERALHISLESCSTGSHRSARDE